MDHPDEGGGNGEIGRPGRESIAEGRQAERPPDDTEQQQRARDVDRHVHDVVAAYVEPAERIVQRERQVDDGAAGDGKLDGGKQHDRGRQLPDLFVQDDGVLIVEDEGPRQCVRVREGAGEHDQRGAQPHGRTPRAGDRRRFVRRRRSSRRRGNPVRAFPGLSA